MGSKKPRVLIVGAGMAGLAAARRLHACAGDLIDLVVLEAGERIGGRILTSEFAGAQVEIGATWIHGIDGNPMYDLVKKAGALRSRDDLGCKSTLLPWERMDGFPTDPLTLAEGGLTVDPILLRRISALFSHLKQLIASGETESDLPSVGAFLRRKFQNYRDDFAGAWIEEAAFAMHECGERTYTAVDDLESLDLAAEKEYLEFPGEHITVPRGYSRVPEFLAQALPPGTVRLRRRVSLIEWREQPVRLHLEDGVVELAEHVIVTVSLGVLKAGIHSEAGLCFSPALPDAKREAIGRLGFGLVTKLFMELEDGNAEEKSPFPFLRMAFDPGRHVSSIPWWIRRTDSICPIHDGSRVLLAWFVGQEAAEVEALHNDEILAGVNATLAGFLPESRGGPGCRISRVRKTGWGRDHRFLGSYSYVPVGSSGDDQDALAEPLPSLHVLFAGEATHRTRYATTHGAYLSGVREADRLLQYYNLHTCGY